MFIRLIRSVLARTVVALFFSGAIVHGALAANVPHGAANQPDVPTRATPPSTPQGFMDGRGLGNDCGVGPNDPDGLMPLCLGYLAGSLDQMMDGSGRVALEETICPPQGLSLGRVRTLVLQYLAANPGERAIAAALVVQRAIHAAYACSDPA